MFKIDLYSKYCVAFRRDAFYLYSITCKYLCDIRSEFIYGINA